MENKYRIEKRLEFDAAHRVMHHESKCRFLHGHRFYVTVCVVPKKGLDGIGRVIDFSVLKRRLGGWLDENWDHQLILHREDKELISVTGEWCRNGKAYLLPYNPTAENLGRFLVEEVCPDLFADCDIEVDIVVVDETPTSRAVVW